MRGIFEISKKTVDNSQIGLTTSQNKLTDLLDNKRNMKSNNGQIIQIFL